MLLDGPVVVINGRQAAWLNLLVATELSKLRSNGLAVPEKVAELLSELRVADERWRATAANGSAEVPQESDPSECQDSDIEDMTVEEARKLLGLFARGVRSALGAGRLEGWKSAGVWRVSRLSVLEYRERRKEDHGARAS
jgi:hypothetical protein